jgi:hypothetical protein
VLVQRSLLRHRQQQNEYLLATWSPSDASSHGYSTRNGQDHRSRGIFDEKVLELLADNLEQFADSKDGARNIMSVNKEAILAAGALRSPQILQVSSIGDPATLAGIKISAIVDLPGVGQNLQDHVLLDIVYSSNYILLSCPGNRPFSNQNT